MIYRTDFAFNIEGEEAQLIVDLIREFPLKEICVTPYTNTIEPSYTTVAIKPIPKYLTEQYREMHINLTTHPAELLLLKEHVVSQLDYLRDSIDAFGSIVFGTARFSEDPTEPVPVEYDPNWKA